MPRTLSTCSLTFTLEQQDYSCPAEVAEHPAMHAADARGLPARAACCQPSGGPRCREDTPQAETDALIASIEENLAAVLSIA